MSEVLLTINATNNQVSLSNRTEVEQTVIRSLVNKESSEWVIACALNECYLNQYYKTPDENNESFTKFELWAESRFGFSKSTALNYRNAFANCYEYKDDVISMRNPAFEGFTVSKINELNSLFTEKGFDFVVQAIENGELKPTMTLKELRKASKDLRTEIVSEQTAEQTAEQNAEQTAEQTAEQNAEQTAEQTAEQNAEQKTDRKAIIESIKDALNKARMNNECRTYVFEQLEKLL